MSTLTNGADPVRVTAQTKIATERAIRAAARKLFVKKGLEATSTRQIASAARIAAGTLFNYFPSKEALALAIAADGFAAGRAEAIRRLEPTPERQTTLEEDLFTLIACEMRALEPIRPFIGEVLEAGLSAFGAGGDGTAGAAIRAQRLEDAATVLARYELGEDATPPVMHLYWSLYLGVLSYWAADPSPKQEDSWALLDRGVRMFAGALKPAGGERAPLSGAPVRDRSHMIAESEATEVQP